MRVRETMLAALGLLVACATPPPPPPPPPSPPPSPVTTEPPVPAACLPTVAACLERAEDSAESGLGEAVAIAAECVSCPNAPPTAYRLQASLQSDAGHRDDARESLLAGVARYPEHAMLWLSLGRFELASQRPREAISALARAYRLNPEDQNFRDEYHHALARLGTEEEKIEAHVQPLLMEAIGRYELEDVDGAERVLASALKAASGAPQMRAQIRHRLGLIAIARGDFGAADTHFTAGLAMVKSPALRALLLVSHAEVLLATERIDDAITAVRSAIQIDDSDALAHTNLAVALATKGDVEASLKALERARVAGIARRLTRGQFAAIDAFAPLTADDRYQHWLEATWPSP